VSVQYGNNVCNFGSPPPPKDIILYPKRGGHDDRATISKEKGLVAIVKGGINWSLFGMIFA